MDKLKALMSRKVAGIPVALIAALFMGGLLWMALRMKSTTVDEEPTDASATDTEDVMSTGDGDASNEQPVFLVPNGVNRGGTVSTDTGTVVGAPGMATPTTNELWVQQVSTWLIGQGVPGTEAATIVNNYMNGISMSVTNSNWINKAIATFGLPPEGAPDYVSLPSSPSPNVETNSPPAPTQASRQVAYGKTHGGKQSNRFPVKHYVQGTYGDTTFRGLARIYYGNNDGVRISSQTYNRGYRDPLPKNRVVLIPAPKAPKFYKLKSRGERTDYRYIAAKNGISPEMVRALNPHIKWPAPRGARVRVG